MNKRTIVFLVFSFYFYPRLTAILTTSVFNFNPFIGGQIGGHEQRAAEIATMFLGLEFNLSFTNTFDRWGLLLSPLWLLPGPSALYAQLAMAIIGSVAILNVYLICEHYHSRQAGIIATLPLALFPSYVFMHSVVQREAMVLFGLTTAFVLIFLPNRYVSTPYNYVFAAGALFIPSYLRFSNAPVILAVVVGTMAIVVLQTDRVSFRRKLQAVTGISIIGATALLVVVNTFLTTQPVQYLADIRERRIRGRATYLEGVVPNSLPELVGFSWIGALYFLYAPFPWHVTQLSDLVIMLESMVGLFFTPFAVLGALLLKERSVPAAVALVLGIVLFSVLYGFGTGNYGTGLRHRQVIFWAIFILGAIGFSSKVRFTL